MSTTIKILYIESQIRTRNVVERSYGVLERRFPVLALGIRLKLDAVEAIIVACAVLHNIAIDANDAVPTTTEIEGFEAMLAATEMPPENIGEEGGRSSSIGTARDILVRNYFANLRNENALGLLEE